MRGEGRALGQALVIGVEPGDDAVSAGEVGGEHPGGEAVARANATPYGLAAGVFTADLARAHRVVARLDAGITWINAYNLTPVEMPFGGVKASGIGRENGRAALDHWSRVKSVYVATGPVEAPF